MFRLYTYILYQIYDLLKGKNDFDSKVRASVVFSLFLLLNYLTIRRFVVIYYGFENNINSIEYFIHIFIIMFNFRILKSKIYYNRFFSKFKNDTKEKRRTGLIALGSYCFITFFLFTLIGTKPLPGYEFLEKTPPYNSEERNRIVFSDSANITDSLNSVIPLLEKVSSYEYDSTKTYYWIDFADSIHVNRVRIGAFDESTLSHYYFDNLNVNEKHRLFELMKYLRKQGLRIYEFNKSTSEITFIYKMYMGGNPINYRVGGYYFDLLRVLIYSESSTFSNYSNDMKVIDKKYRFELLAKKEALIWEGWINKRTDYNMMKYGHE